VLVKLDISLVVMSCRLASSYRRVEWSSTEIKNEWSCLHFAISRYGLHRTLLSKMITEHTLLWGFPYNCMCVLVTCSCRKTGTNHSGSYSRGRIAIPGYRTLDHNGLGDCFVFCRSCLQISSPKLGGSRYSVYFKPFYSNAVMSFNPFDA
jgi:hypothetical protein